MSCVPLIVGALQGNPSVTGLLANGSASVFGIAAPQKSAAPCAIVVPLSEVETVNLDGIHDGAPEARFVILVRAGTASLVLTVGDAIVAALKDLHAVAGQRIQIIRENVDSAELEREDLFRRTIGFRIHYTA